MDRNPKETARKTADEALSRLAAELKAGRCEALTNYLSAMSRLRRYSWTNVLLIAAQRPDATHVAGIHAWNDLGRAIKKGEKGIVIFAPGGRNQEQDRQALPQDNPFRQTGTRAAYVFDVSQTDGQPLPEFIQASGDIWKYGEQLRDLIAKRGIELQVDRTIEPARGISSAGKIQVKPGLSPVEWISVLTHELAHEMLHHRPEAAALSRDTIEAQAYGVAYVVACGLDIKTHTPIAEYLAPNSGDTTAIAQTLAVVHETSAKILDELLPEAGISTRPAAESVHQNRVPLDAKDFAKIHSEYGDRLVRSMAGFVGDRDKAEDIAARAFEAAWAKRDGFRGESSPYTWLQAIARNEARQSWSREQTGRFDSMDHPDAREFSAPEIVADELERTDDRLRLQKALAEVPAKHRRALISHFVDGRSTREIARCERIPIGTVLSRIYTGKQLLRHALAAPITGPHADVMAQGPASTSLGKQRPATPEPRGYQQPSIQSPEPRIRDR